jgi:hypothetical protein
MTMISAPSSFPFPHPKLTPIDGKQTSATIRLLQREVYANARSVHSDLGGRLNGHLGMAIPDAQYFMQAHEQFIAPIHPGVQPAHTDDTSRSRVAKHEDTNL